MPTRLHHEELEKGVITHFRAILLKYWLWQQDETCKCYHRHAGEFTRSEGGSCEGYGAEVKFSGSRPIDRENVSTK
jgi:hypothetical protein